LHRILHWTQSGEYAELMNRDQMKIEFKLDNVQTSNVFNRFEILQIF